MSNTIPVRSSVQVHVESVVRDVGVLVARDILLDEVIATLSLPENHPYIDEKLRPYVDQWRKRLGLAPVVWPVDELADEEDEDGGPA